MAQLLIIITQSLGYLLSKSPNMVIFSLIWCNGFWLTADASVLLQINTDFITTLLSFKMAIYCPNASIFYILLYNLLYSIIPLYQYIQFIFNVMKSHGHTHTD